MDGSTPTSLNAAESQIPDPARSILRQWGIIQDEVQVRPIVRADLERLITDLGKGKPRGIDLSGADIRRIDLRGMNLSEIRLTGCNLEGAIAMPMLTDKYKEGDVSYWTGGYEEALSSWQSGETPDWIGEVKQTNLSGALLNLANLSYGDFRWAKLDGAGMTRCNLTGSDLSYANMQKACLNWARVYEATAQGASLKGASLKSARIIDADLGHANLKDADLAGAFISPLTNMSGVQWDHKHICRAERDGDYEKAIALYRNLKEWHHRNGYYKIAGEFHYREREAERKAHQQSIKKKLEQNKKDLIEVWKGLWKGGK